MYIDEDSLFGNVAKRVKDRGAEEGIGDEEDGSKDDAAAKLELMKVVDDVAVNGNDYKCVYIYVWYGMYVIGYTHT